MLIVNVLAESTSGEERKVTESEERLLAVERQAQELRQRGRPACVK